MDFQDWLKEKYGYLRHRSTPDITVKELMEKEALHCENKLRDPKTPDPIRIVCKRELRIIDYLLTEVKKRELGNGVLNQKVKSVITL